MHLQYYISQIIIIPYNVSTQIVSKLSLKLSNSVRLDVFIFFSFSTSDENFTFFFTHTYVIFFLRPGKRVFGRWECNKMPQIMQELEATESADICELEDWSTVLDNVP